MKLTPPFTERVFWEKYLKKEGQKYKDDSLVSGIISPETKNRILMRLIFSSTQKEYQFEFPTKKFESMIRILAKRHNLFLRSRPSQIPVIRLS